MTKAVAIVLMCIGSAIIYGVLHDQVTAHVCVEYFTVVHPLVFPTESPVLLGLGWGVIATWWTGLLLGVPLASPPAQGLGPARYGRWCGRSSPSCLSWASAPFSPGSQDTSRP